LNTVIIVAGGIGQRMGNTVPKQFLLLNNKPIIFYSIQPFLDFDPGIQVVIVLPKEHITTWGSLCKKYCFHVEHKIVEGGETRYHSVKNGLVAVQDCEWIAVHDSVRPFASKSFIEHCFDEAKKLGSAVPAVEVNESVREILGMGSHPLKRSRIRLVQTPQVFLCKMLKEAYKVQYNDSFTDDASVVEAAGNKIYLADGLKDNIKITTPDDMKWAEWKINQKS
jgi:2-C-methyl-D-erythritol 4-phosphate cytidylyltransferase